jgi:hypothetical protein
MDVEELLSALAGHEHRIDSAATISLRLVDAAWHHNVEDFARQALRLRQNLEDRGLEHDARRVSAGLLIVVAAQVIARLYRQPVRAVNLRLRATAETAKVEHRFPWHLLDG